MTTMYLALPLTWFFFYLKSGELTFELLESNLWTWDDNDTPRQSFILSILKLKIKITT